MAEKRSYGDRCGIARALDVVGDRWALLVVRELVLGPKRFTGLRAGLPNLTADVLSQRLRALEEAGILTREQLDPPAAARVYQLTEAGRELEPVLLALAGWGSRRPFPATDRELGADSFVLALKALFRPERAGAGSGRYQLRVDGQAFAASMEDGRFEVRRGVCDSPDCVIESNTATLSKILWHRQPPEDAVDSGTLTVAGDVPAARRFLALFPPPAAAPA